MNNCYSLRSQDQILIKLSQIYQFNFQSLSELKNATNLLSVVNKLIFNNNNPVLCQKLSIQKSKSNHSNNRAGNNVININVMLKQIKQDKQLMKNTDNQIKQMTFFNLLEDDQKLTYFLNWIIDKAESKEKINRIDHNVNSLKVQEEQQINTLSSNRFKDIHIGVMETNINKNNTKLKSKIYFQENQNQNNTQQQLSKLYQQNKQKQNIQNIQNGFQNLYFASQINSKQDSPKKNKVQSNNPTLQGDKIVRKGSFKLLKPKVIFNQQDKSGQIPKQLQFSPQKKQTSHVKNLLNQNSLLSNNMNQIQKNSKNLIQPQELKQISMIQQSNNFYNPNISSLQLINSSNIYIQDDNINTNNFVTKTSNFYNAQQQNKNRDASPLINRSLTTTPIPKHTQEQNRKTIPKNLSKPPLYRNSSNGKNKQNINFDKKSLTTFQIYPPTIQRKNKQKTFFNFNNSEYIQKSAQKLNINQNQNISSFYDNKNHIRSQSMISNIKNLNKKQNIKSQVQQYLEEQMIRDNIVNSKLYQQNGSNSKIIHTKNKYLKKEIYELQNQISKQSSQLLSFSNMNNQNYQSAPIYIDQLKLNSKSIHESKSKKQSNPQLNDSVTKSINQKNKNSSRKVLKINLTPIDQTQKHQIIQWLVGINFLTAHEIDQNTIINLFKNGVKFVEICNYYIGRAKKLSYFANPKKNAQIHSNYSKMFQYLKQLQNFQSQLLFSYQFFVPQPHQYAIWNLLLSIFKTFYKIWKSKNYQSQLIDTKQDQIMRKSLIKSNNQTSLSANKLDSQRNKMNQRLIEKKQGQNKRLSSLKKSKRSGSKSNFQTQIQFVRQVPQDLKHKDLVQNIQPEAFDNQNNQFNNQNEKNVIIQGYKQRYLRKTLSTNNMFNSSMQTPKKVMFNYHDRSLIVDPSRNMLKNSNVTSSRKALQKSLQKSQSSASKFILNSKQKNVQNRPKLMPKVTLNMQMKVTKFLKKINLTLDQDKITQSKLFEDTIRNGTLINIILNLDKQKEECKYYINPKSIQNCRQNYSIALNLIKSKYGQQQFKGLEIYNSYFPFVQQILKGQKSLFYGLAFNIIQIYTKKGFDLFKQQYFENKGNQNTLNLKTGKMEKQKIMAIIKQFQNNHISWIRSLERINPQIAMLKIRDQQSLKQSISSGQLLFLLSKIFIKHGENLNLIYQNPLNIAQKQANLRKILAYFYQNNIFPKDHFKGVERQIALKNVQIINYIVQQFIPFTINQEVIQNLNKLCHINIIDNNNVSNMIMSKSETLNKYLNLGNQINEKQKRLQTTVDEIQNNHNQNLKMHQSSNLMNIVQQEQIQILWMRKLGFVNCNLSLKNGVILCRLISKLTRNNIIINQSLTPSHQLSKPQSLLNIRKALKLLPGCKWDQIDIYQADNKKTIEIYNFIKDKFKHTYEMTRVLSIK